MPHATRRQASSATHQSKPAAHLRLAAVLGGVGHAAGPNQHRRRGGQRNGTALLEQHAHEAAGQHPQRMAVALAAANLLALQASRRECKGS